MDGGVFISGARQNGEGGKEDEIEKDMRRKS